MAKRSFKVGDITPVQSVSEIHLITDATTSELEEADEIQHRLSHIESLLE